MQTPSTAAQQINQIPPPPVISHVVNTAVIISVVVLVVGTLISVVVLAIMLPDHRDAIGIMVGFVTPIIGGMMALAYGQRQLHLDVNSRLTELVQAKAAEAKIQGHIDERAGISIRTTDEAVTHAAKAEVASALKDAEIEGIQQESKSGS